MIGELKRFPQPSFYCSVSTQYNLTTRYIMISLFEILKNSAGLSVTELIFQYLNSDHFPDNGYW